MSLNNDFSGIPSGYLSFIEQRLLDTELVVFELLSAIYKSNVPIQPQRLSETERRILVELSQKQPKSAKIEEWRSQPLVTDEHRHEWWSRRYQLMSGSTQACPNRLSQDAVTPRETWVDASPLSVQYEEVQLHTAMQPSMAESSQSPAPHVSWQQSLSMDSIELGPMFDGDAQNAFHPSSMEEVRGGPSRVIPEPLDQTTGSERSQMLSAERLRKYF
jgi:hypothetical protein